MLKQFVMWLFGYNKIIVCKSANRLISLLAKNNVNIWKLENNKDAITFYILKKDMKVLDLYCNKTLTTYKIASSKGLYIIFNRLKKKIPFLIGLLVTAKARRLTFAIRPYVPASVDLGIRKGPVLSAFIADRKSLNLH